MVNEIWSDQSVKKGMDEENQDVMHNNGGMGGGGRV